MGSLKPCLDVIIPARDEAQSLAGCLGALLREAQDVELKVIVVVNGPDRDAALAVISDFIEAFANVGATLAAVEEPTPGKARAMNRGDLERRGGSVMYLDADTVLLAGTLAPLATALIESSEPLLMSPQPRLAAPATRLSRHWTLLWRTLPAVAGDVVGAGCYAVNALGRTRWDRFPDLLGDDSFVRSRFLRSERRLSVRGGFLQIMPEGRALVASIRRWRDANFALRSVPASINSKGDRGTGSHPGASWTRNLLHLLSHRDVWAYLPGFLLVTWAAWRAQRPDDAVGAWKPIRQDVANRTSSSAKMPLVQVLTQATPSADVSTLQSLLRSRWAQLDFSGLGPGRLAQVDGEEMSSRPLPTHVLLVDDALSVDGAVLDALLAVALRFPAAGAYGLSAKSLDLRTPFAIRLILPTTDGNALFARGTVLFDILAWRDLCSSPGGPPLPLLMALGWHPILVQAGSAITDKL